jgi:hypothetical protein
MSTFLSVEKKFCPSYSHLGNESLQMDVNGSSLVWYYPLSMHASGSDASMYRHKLKQACCSLYNDIVTFSISSVLES